MRNRLLWASVLATLGTSIANASPIVVTANRDATPIEKVGGSISLITEEEIQRSQLTHVSEILRQVPGVDVVRSGGRGGNTSIFLRGANSEHTLVVIDGIEMNNPGNPARAFNFADLTLENVERIEILRGPQSGLWGSNAIGGVINIITKTADRGTNVSASTEGGSFERFVQRARVAHGLKDGGGSVSLGFTREDEGGISAAESRDGNQEDDGFQNTSLTFRAKFTPTEQITFDNTLRFNNSRSDLDDTGGIGGDDPNRTLDNEQLFWRSSLAADFFEGKWNSTVGFSLTDHDFTDKNGVDELHPVDTLYSRFKGQMVTVDFLNTIQASEEIRLLIGAETQLEKASSRYQSDGSFGPYEDLFGQADVRNNGYFTDVLVDFTKDFTTSAAIRVDDHDTFGTEVTYRISPAYRLPEYGTKFRASVGTGFRAPSLNQLYSSFGNPDLNPEETTGWELGVDQVVLEGMATLGGTFYRQSIDNLITFNDATFIVENIDEAQINGFELYIEAEPMDDLSFRADYTYLDAEDDKTKEDLVRRAANRFTLSANYQFAEERGRITAKLKYVGDREDMDFTAFPATRTSLASYSVVDILASYNLTEQIKLFARVENLFDRKYQDVLGFGTYGVGGFGGIEFTL
ncbi:MAG: TonB-dependent receptor [Bdellovibrionales bacterium]|nr:TonB-dependent receptor [Bdellovibrionales bacterium]